jgi:hypothetical protein
LLDAAFARDYEVNGPSLYRICETMLSGWRRYRSYPEERVRRRFEREVAGLRHVYGGMLWAMEKYLRKANSSVSARIQGIRREIAEELGWVSGVTAAVIGPLLLWSARREERRLAHGIKYEPPTIIERRNWAPASN